MKKIDKAEEIKTDDYLIIKWSSIREAGYDEGDAPTYRTIQIIYKMADRAEWLSEIERTIQLNEKYPHSKTIFSAIKVGSVASVRTSIIITEN